MRTSLVITILVVGFTSYTNAQSVNIPDANFKAYLVGNTSINTNADTEIQLSEANSFSGSIVCNSLAIADLTGIEEFTMLSVLSCMDNQLSILNISSNLNLNGLNCAFNNLSSLDVSNNVALTVIGCGNNNLTNLDVSNNNLLTNLSCESNQLTALDLQFNTSITDLSCWGNQILNLDVNNNTALIRVSCSDNSLTNLNFEFNTNLSELYCGSSSLTTLDISFNTLLTKLSCSNALLTTLDLSNNIALLELACDNLLITTIDLTQNQSLTQIACLNNSNMDSLILSQNGDLTSVYCTNNINLTTLNIANGNNQILFSFFASNNPSLTCIQVDDVIFANAQGQWQKDISASYSENCDSNIGVEENISTIEFETYPNPVTGVLSINGDFNDYKLINMLGEIIDENRIFNNQIDFTNFDKGIYTLVVTTSSEKMATKLILKD